MAGPVIVAHYHEVWLKGRNREFFLGKLISALHKALDGLPMARLTKPGDRVVIEMAEGAPLEETLERLKRVSGVAYYGVARLIERRPRECTLGELSAAAWEEVAGQRFSTFAVRARRSDKSYPHSTMDIERAVGRALLDRLRAAGRDASVRLSEPELTCRIEITPGPALIYARRVPGPGGLPANTGGRLMCLLSGGFDSAVAAQRMMKRGAHVSFAHFYGAGARPGESSMHVARELVRRLVAWQFTAKLFLVPFEEIQREIVRAAPETYRLLLYRRLMMRIAERLARRDHCIALLTGDSLGQVASQTLLNMVSVGDAARMPVFRPLAGSDKQEIIAAARQIGTYEISAEPFHDCCPVYLPKVPALHASPAELAAAEATLDVETLVRRGVQAAQCERYLYSRGRVEQVSSPDSRSAVKT
jgi:thiamine biosynthesis protein ThiI